MAETGRAVPRLYVRPDGNWQRQLAPRHAVARPALFLDRDGVLVEDPGYMSDPAQVRLMPGAGAACRWARSAGLVLVVVSNQSGVGRGLFDWDAYRAVEDRMLDLLQREGVNMDGSLACPFNPDGDNAFGGTRDWRKPEPGMLRAASLMLNLDLTRSCIVGDRLTDLEAGERAGLRAGIHVLTGHGASEAERVRQHEFGTFRVFTVTSIAELPDHPGMNWTS